jgi:hypothetical protein
LGLSRDAFEGSVGHGIIYGLVGYGSHVLFPRLRFGLVFPR